MSTLKLKKPAHPGGPGKRDAAQPARPPLRGAASPPRPRQALAQAQQERAEREERYRQQAADERRGPHADRPARGRDEAPRGAFGQQRPRPEGPFRARDDDRRGAFGQGQSRQPQDNYPRGRDDPPRDARRQSPQDNFPRGRDDSRSAFGGPRSRDDDRRGAFGPAGSRERQGAGRPDRAGPRPAGDRSSAPAYVPRGDKPVGGRDRRPDLREPRAEAPRRDAFARPAVPHPAEPASPAAGPTRRDDSAASAIAETGVMDTAHPGAEGGAGTVSPPAGVRLSKRMSELGLASRREADEWIERGWVKVDGVVVDTLGSRVLPEQAIEIDSRAAGQQAQRVTVLLHKPAGYVSGQAEDGNLPATVLCTPDHRSALDRSGITYQRDHVRGIAPAGRLDMESTGLLVYTQDGRVAKQLIAGDGQIEKEYVVKVANENGVGRATGLPDEALERLRHGLEIDGVPLREAEVDWLDDENLRFVLREGKKRQIRRMCEAVGLQVLELKRVRIGRIHLGDLAEGQWRYLAPHESFT